MAQTNSNKLKQLETLLNKTQNEYDVLNTKIANDQRVLASKKKAIENIKSQIQAISTNKEITISEHALLRYLERVSKVDTEAVKKDIITPELIKMVETLGGNGKYPVDNITLVIRDYVVTTILMK